LRRQLAVAFAGVLAACGNPQADRCGSSAAVQEAILTPRCALSGCHRSPDPAGSLDFTASDFDRQLVGVAAAECGGQVRVVAGDADASYLIHKVSDVQPPCGDRMPVARAQLSVEDLACLRTWVAALSAAAGGDGGAPDLATPPPTCPAGQSACGTQCVDKQTDKGNCGACGTTCPVACSAGTCVTTCPPGTSNCSGSCVDTTTSAINCGACSKACPIGQICSAGACSCGASASFATQLQPIFTSACAVAGCHSGAMPRARMSLVKGSAYGALVNVAANTCPTRLRVKPGAVADSYLMNKLTGIGMCSGTQMPKTGSPLPAAQLDLMRAWICSGALNN